MKNLRNENKFGRVRFKRGLALLLAGCMLATALTGCGKDKDKDKQNPSSAPPPLSSAAPQLQPTPTPPATAKAVRVNVDDSLNVRASGSTEAEILGQVEDGDELALLADTAQSGWYQVQYKGGTGYVSADYVQVIDVTIEKYNALKAGSAAEATATPDPSATADPAASQSPGAPTSGPNLDSEDGE